MAVRRMRQGDSNTLELKRVALAASIERDELPIELLSAELDRRQRERDEQRFHETLASRWGYPIPRRPK